MRSGAQHLDRLLPRHPGGTGLDFAWNVHEARAGLFKKEETFSRAVIRDLSLDGALVEVPAGEEHEIGDRVDVRFEGMDGHAEIRHRNDGPDGSHIYGVRFIPEDGFGAAVNKAVGELRGRSAELKNAWNRAT
jgi:PilZ domain